MNYNYPPDPIIDAINRKYCWEYKRVELQPGWISNSLEEEMQKWNPEETRHHPPILINAPTGSGKNWFIVEKLAKYAAEHNRFVLLLSNRYSLKLQEQLDLSETDEDSSFGSSSIQNCKVFGNIVLMLYHSVPYEFVKTLRVYPIGFIVLDEAHFFCSDALFNVDTAHILKTIIGKSENIKRIYLSATPNDVKHLMALEERCNLEHLLYHPEPWQSYASLAVRINMQNYIKEYYIPADFSFVKLHFFTDWNKMVTDIGLDSTEDQWLIFVSSKQDGHELHQDMKKYSKYVDADYKFSNPNEIRRLARLKQFREKVLITTTVLYNGVDFYSDRLKHIVVDSADSTEIKQMLGRKRRKGDEIVHLHIKEKSAVDIDMLIKSYQEKEKILQEFLYNQPHFDWHRWGTLTESQQLLFKVYPNGVLTSNEYAPYQLSRLIGKYEQIADRFALEGPLAFFNEVCEWFGKSYESEMGSSTHDELVENVDKYLGKACQSPMDRKNMQNFAEKLIKMVELLKKDINAYKKIYGDETHMNSDTETIIQYFSLPYKIQKLKKSETNGEELWQIVETSDTSSSPPTE